MASRRISIFIAWLIYSLALYSPSAASVQEELVLTIHPYKSPSKLLSAFQPLADYLSQRLNGHVSIQISKNYDEHIRLIGNNQTDIAYMGPASYVMMVKRYGRKPILACQQVNGKITFKGKIIVAKSAPITSLKDLSNKKFAFGDPGSTMSHLVPHYMLLRAGIRLEEHHYLGSHDNVALAVLSGDYDAGAVKEAVFYKYKNKGLRVLATTPALTEHLFVSNSSLKRNTVKQLRKALLELKRTDGGRRIMMSIKPGITAMMPVQDSNYNNLRQILDYLAMHHEEG
jgi:phosphonate transport system substrate-binding protein